MNYLCPQINKDVSQNNFTILITGGAGFIGSNLCEYFLQRGHRVICLDNFSTGFRHNIEHLFVHRDFSLIEGDIRDYATCLKALDGVEYVLHQAALGSVPRSINDPITTNEVNVSGFLATILMLQGNRNQKICICGQFVYLWRFGKSSQSESM